MEIGAETLFPSHLSIACELILNSVESGASIISLNVDFFHNLISCKDNGTGILPHIFPKLLSANSNDTTDSKNYCRTIRHITKIAQIADVDIQTKTELDRYPRRTTKGCPQITSPLLATGTEIIISSIFAKNPTKLTQISNPKSKPQFIFELKQFIYTISLNFLTIKFIINNTIIPISNSIEDRWRTISGSYLKLTSDDTITFFRNRINIGFQFPFSPFMINKFPVKRWIVNGIEQKPTPNSISVVNNKMTHDNFYHWSNDGLVCESTRKTSFLKEPKYQTQVSNLELSNMNVIGIFEQSYIICTNTMNNILYAIDQHACHERINLENLLDNYVTDPFPSQELKNPIKLPINSHHEFSLSTLRQAKRWGWQISKLYVAKNKFSSYNGVSWFLFSIPRVETYLVEEISGLISYLEKIEHETNFDFNDIPDCIMHALQTRACKKSIKFGDVISNERAHSLIIQLSQCKKPNYCAHCRTVAAPLIHLSTPDINYIQI